MAHKCFIEFPHFLFLFTLLYLLFFASHTHTRARAYLLFIRVYCIQQSKLILIKSFFIDFGIILYGFINGMSPLTPPCIYIQQVPSYIRVYNHIINCLYIIICCAITPFNLSLVSCWLVKIKESLMRINTKKSAKLLCSNILWVRLVFNFS